MATRIDAQDIQERIIHYLDRAATGGERIVLERDGQPFAALVSVDDLRRLEAIDAAVGSENDEAAGEARFRRELEKAGIIIHFPSEQPVPSSSRRLLHVEGPPISEQILADRR